MQDNRMLTASGIVIKDNQVLVVRQSYGEAKGFLIIPGATFNLGKCLNGYWNGRNKAEPSIQKRRIFYRSASRTNLKTGKPTFQQWTQL